MTSRLHPCRPAALLAGLAGLLVSAAACAPDTAGPVTVMALVQGANRAFEPTPVELTTVRNVTSLEGEDVRLVGGARIVVDSEDPLLSTNGGNLTEEQLREVFVKDEGDTPEASYIEKDGVFWPADFDTWNMVTTYFNFERTLTYFQEMGVGLERIGDNTVYYFPEFVLADVSNRPLEDNALYFSPIRAFAVVPFDRLQDVPLGMNLGVIGHEFSHRVFNALVYGNAAYPEAFIEWALPSVATPQINILKAFDEGLADYHGHGVSCFFPSGCDSRFIESSIPGAIADARDIADSTHCVSQELVNSLNTLSVERFSAQGLDYELGTAFATALYQAGAKTGKQRALQEYLLQGYSDPSSTNPGLAQIINANLATPQFFTLGVAVNPLISHISDPDLRKVVCDEVMDHLQLTRDQLPACPASAVGGNACQDLQP